ncbi:phosphotransferase [Nonomuraea turkmeniaca]|uniref:phosphotransferase n=1 Tax=Nonomuraea turkmeniaca TaxID=103838 RepID=UPI003CCC50AE
MALVTGTDVPAPGLVAVDPTAAHCECPLLLMTHLAGRTVLDDEGLETRVPLLARQLVAIHALRPAERPRKYVTLMTADTVVVPKGAVAAAWGAAINVIRKPAPPYEGRFLHRDFQPGNVLFDMSPQARQVPGSPASSTGPRPPGARQTSMSRTAPPVSRCCTDRRGVPLPLPPPVMTAIRPSNLPIAADSPCIRLYYLHEASSVGAVASCKRVGGGLRCWAGHTTTATSQRVGGRSSARAGEL